MPLFKNELSDLCTTLFRKSCRHASGSFLCRCHLPLPDVFRRTLSCAVMTLLTGKHHIPMLSTAPDSVEIFIELVPFYRFRHQMPMARLRFVQLFVIVDWKYMIGVSK